MRDVLELLVLLVGILLVFGTAAWAGLSAAPWVPTRANDSRRLFRLARVQPGETVVDLGCGDARVLLLAAREFGARGIGYEVSLIPFLVAKLRVALSPFRRRITIRYKNFYRADLAEADVVFCFLTPPAMEKLKTKFVRELRPGARVVSYAFAMKDLPNLVTDKPNATTTAAYLYEQGAQTVR